MSGFFDEMERFAAVANDTANIGYLLAAAVVLLILAAIGVVWMRQRINRLPSAQQEPRQAGDPVEDFIDQALRYEADQQWLRRGERPEDGRR